MAKEYSVVTKLVANTKGFVKNMDSASKKTSKFANDFGKKTDNLDKKVSKVGQSFKKAMGVIGGAVAVGGLIQLGKSAIEAGANAEAMKAQFKQVFGDISKDAQQTVDQLGKDFGMTPNRIKPALTMMTSMFKGLGMDTEEAMTTASDAVTLVADASAFYDKSFEEANASLNSFIKGNYEGGESIGLFANETQLASWASKELGLDWQNLDEKGKQVARLKYAEAMQKSAGATGQARRESDSYQNQLGNLKQTWQDLMAKFAKPVLKPVINGFQTLAGWISKIDVNAIIQKFKGFGSYIGSIFTPIIDLIKTKFNDFMTFLQNSGAMDGLKTAFDGVKAGFQWFIDFIPTATTAISDFLNKWDFLVAGLAGALATFGLIKLAIGAYNIIMGIATGVTTAFGAVIAFITSPIGIVVLAIGALIAIVVALWKNWDTVSQFLSTSWEWIKNIAVTVFTAIGTFFKTVWNGIKNIVMVVWNAIKTFLGTIWNGIKAIVLSVFNAIKTYFTTVFNIYKNIILSVWNAIKTFLSATFNTIKTIVMTVFNAISSFFSKIWNGIKNIFNTVVNAVVNFVKTRFNNLKSNISSIFNAIKNIASKIWNGIKTTVSNLVTGAVDFVKSRFSNLKSNISSIFNSIKSVASSVWNGVKSTVTNVASTISSKVKSVFNGMKSTVTGIWNGIKSTTSSVWNGIKSAISTPINKAKSLVKSAVDKIKGILDFDFKLPKIKLPHFSLKGKLDLVPPGLSVPKLSVNWYKKGGVFGDASIIGVGEEQGVSEAVLPLKDSVLGKIGKMIANTMDIDFVGALKNLTNSFNPSTVASAIAVGASVPSVPTSQVSNNDNSNHTTTTYGDIHVTVENGDKKKANDIAKEIITGIKKKGK